MRAANTIGERRTGSAGRPPAAPARGVGSPRAGAARGTRLSLLVLFVLLALSACVSPPITVDASDAAPIARSATIHVALAAAADAGASPPGSAIDPGLGAELEDALKARAERALEARGYATGSASESDLVLELAPRAERTTRRTWSSDPDASALRTVAQAEAVLALRAHDPQAGHELWRGEARTKLADAARAPGPRATALWSQLLDRALERVPRKPD